MNKHEKIEQIVTHLQYFSDFQIEIIEGLLHYLTSKFDFIHNSENSDIATIDFMESFGEILRIHHYFSNEPFTKDKFEFAFARVLNYCGHKAVLSPKGRQGYDIRVDETRISLKTQADSKIKANKIHISKFMELGKGSWETIQDLGNLRMRFMNHIKDYDRIFSLRCLCKGEIWSYQLVEIPLDLLMESAQGDLYFVKKSKQIPIPAYCDVTTASGENKFRLYFDGGTERKLQVKDLLVKYCKLHGAWKFKGPS